VTEQDEERERERANFVARMSDVSGLRVFKTSAEAKAAQAENEARLVEARRIMHERIASEAATIRRVPGSLFDELVGLVDPTLLPESGEVFMSGRSSFASACPIYVLGLNPGGNPDLLPEWSISRNIHDSRTLAEREHWSSYSDESWHGSEPGTRPFQRRMLHLFAKCGLDDPRQVPASNLIFVRTRSEAHLKNRKAELMAACWPFHQRVIEGLQARVIVALGKTCGAWVRDKLDAHDEIDTFREVGGYKRWSRTHQNRDGIQVVTLAHPSWANWINPDADPTALVLRALARGGGD
jgi:hypothetical protein